MKLMRQSTAEMTLATYAQTIGEEKMRGWRESGVSCSGEEGECSLVAPFWTHAAFSLLIGPRSLGYLLHLFGGAERDRTADLLVANEALSQLSYSPTPMRI